MEFFFLGILGRCLHFGEPVSSSPPKGVLILWVIYSLLCSGGGPVLVLPHLMPLHCMHRYRHPRVDSDCPESLGRQLFINLVVGQVWTPQLCTITATKFRWLRVEGPFSLPYEPTEMKPWSREGSWTQWILNVLFAGWLCVQFTAFFLSPSITCWQWSSFDTVREFSRVFAVWLSGRYR